MNNVSLGLSGDQGSFSEEAALLYAKKNALDPRFFYLIDMESVLAAIEKKTIDLGVFPVVNFKGGLVTPAFVAMGKHLFEPIDDLWLPVHHCLMVLPSTKAHMVSQIVSHPQGLIQCKQYLQEHFEDIPLMQWCDTAKAAKDLATGELSSLAAVIAPEGCASLYGLEIIAKDIQDSKTNVTAFVIVKHAGVRHD
ncbi:MAG: chorismate mutase [Legionella sp.]|nr:chorismate mutase [Legionella sp.]